MIADVDYSVSKLYGMLPARRLWHGLWLRVQVRNSPSFLITDRLLSDANSEARSATVRHGPIIAVRR
jgi:hypothetical protein